MKYLVLALALLTGCVSSRISNLRKNSALVMPGMSKQQVFREMGKPTRVFHPDDGKTVWVYQLEYRMCKVAFEGEIAVTPAACQDDQVLKEEYKERKAIIQSISDHYGENNRKSRAYSGCTGLPGLSGIGCHSVCMDGEWHSVCN